MTSQNCVDLSFGFTQKDRRHTNVQSQNYRGCFGTSGGRGVPGPAGAPGEFGGFVVTGTSSSGSTVTATPPAGNTPEGPAVYTKFHWVILNGRRVFLTFIIGELEYGSTTTQSRGMFVDLASVDASLVPSSPFTDELQVSGTITTSHPNVGGGPPAVGIQDCNSLVDPNQIATLGAQVGTTGFHVYNLTDFADNSWASSYFGSIEYNLY